MDGGDIGFVSLQPAFEELQHPGRRYCAIARGLVLERIGREEMAGAGDDDPARIDAGLVERGPELLRLRWIDDVIGVTVDEEESRAISVDRRVADRR